MGSRAQVEMGTRERPKVRVPKKETQVGKEERLSGGTPKAEADLKELRKSMERMELKKPTEEESFLKVLGFQEETGNFMKCESYLITQWLSRKGGHRGRLLLKVLDSVVLVLLLRSVVQLAKRNFKQRKWEVP